ncbi:hypothetical protein K7711_18910 [Nocardia sp. CA2R105]|uniref:hypothetical protein n=1 Tax=Nocardia coffeae TaxID=2873381 RepID=UPI001CA6B34B|nr:hypothetical protein [Nocardia coffeae]MBY8858557.1 hypothetical protein [Nocardia coffeae]
MPVPEDLRWEYSYMYDSGGHLKPLNEVESMPADQGLGPSPTSDIQVLYRIMTARYGHPPSCGEPYPTGAAGKLNTTVMEHKALSCTDIPADLRQRYWNLFESNGDLISWRVIQKSPFDPENGSIEGEVPALYYEVVNRLGHPISCPKG